MIPIRSAGPTARRPPSGPTTPTAITSPVSARASRSPRRRTLRRERSSCTWAAQPPAADWWRTSPTAVLPTSSIVRFLRPPEHTSRSIRWPIVRRRRVNNWWSSGHRLPVRATSVCKRLHCSKRGSRCVALSRNEKHQFDTPQRGIAAALSLVLMIVFDTTTLLASHEVGGW